MKIKKIAFFYAALCLVIQVFMADFKAEAAANSDTGMLRIASPVKALISPNSGRLEVVQEAEIQNRDNMRILEFLIPEDSENLNLEVPGHTILRWTMEPYILPENIFQNGQRRKILQEATQLKANLETVKARMQVWKAQTGAAEAQEIEKRQTLMQQEMPLLAARQAELERQIILLDRQLANMPESGLMGQKVSVVLAPAPGNETHANVHYNYDLFRCGWQPIYDFNARIESGDSIEVRLMAEVWQYSGMDWSGTEIILATQGTGAREPAPLVKWIVGKQETPAPQPRAAVLSAKNLAAGMKESAAATMEDSIPVHAPVIADMDSIYATWQLQVKGLPEGRARVALGDFVWKTNLQWLARPTTEDNRVWLFAKYDLPENQAWPAGAAQFNLNGQSMGGGTFVPRSRNVTLYFGNDPRVNVRTTVDTDKQGETGFINTSKTWTGAWTYTISNEHAQAIKVRVERPAPRIANEQITVTYKDNPPSKVDEKEHMVVWDMEVPAHGQAVIQHGITISSPEKLPLFPVVP